MEDEAELVSQRSVKGFQIRKVAEGNRSYLTEEEESEADSKVEASRWELKGQLRLSEQRRQRHQRGLQYQKQEEAEESVIRTSKVTQISDDPFTESSKARYEEAERCS
ncbi:unnamed protein product [Arabis nemorensis]|uniref:Uncharacterized protein n=1 Tax=Arabis nemorensis TaxID=586526 RepID=A0A565CNK1_9BRAS|nr:unnamed protein product [Arabis nemorensis]